MTHDELLASALTRWVKKHGSDTMWKAVMDCVAEGALLIKQQEAEIEALKEALKREVYPNRSVIHKNMGPPDSCERCNGRGWYPREIPNPDGSGDYYDSEEVYCDCPCGQERNRIESKGAGK